MTEDLGAKLQEFEEWMYERFSRSTIEDTMRKMRFFAKKCDLGSRDSIKGFLGEERRKGSSKQKVNEYIKFLNRWLQFRGEDKFIYLRTTKRQFVVKRYDQEEVKALISGTRGPAVEDARDHAMVILALNTGLRRSEIANLRMEHVHDHYLTVVGGKGEKNRDVYLDPETRRILLEYLKMRNSRDSPYVFTTRLGRITPEYMGNIAGRISEKTGVKFSWHKCRHTYAKNLISSDVDLQTISQMLGHERLDTTAIYSVLDTEEALERVRTKRPRFYRDDEMFKSRKSYDNFDGLAGIRTLLYDFGGIRPW